MGRLKISFRGDEYTSEQKREMWLDIHFKSTCPDCGSTDSMVEGPHGGQSINIMCTFCHTIFWTTLFYGFGSYPIGTGNPTQTEWVSKHDKITYTGRV